MNIWMLLTNALNFTGIKDATVWQGLFVQVVFVSLLWEVLKAVYKLANYVLPLNLLIGNTFRKNKSLVFVSELSQANKEFEHISDPRYVAIYPKPLPVFRHNVAKNCYINVDPVWSDADGRCLGEVYNLLGRINCTDVECASISKHWDTWDFPIISIGFNPKTFELLQRCTPLHFTHPDPHTLLLNKNSYQSFNGSDYAVVQKTFDSITKQPVFILAGLGTLGTATSGKFLNDTAVTLGKLYGNKPFVVLIESNWQQGMESFKVTEMYPQPPILNRFLYPIIYCRFKDKVKQK